MNAIEMQGIVKKFHNFTANDHIDFYVEKGEIHSLLGENGAGKTTLMNILYGLYHCDEGTILIDGKKVTLESPLEAIARGISMVHQHFMLVDALSVAENIVIGSEPHKGLVFDYNRACKAVNELSDTYGLKVNPHDKIENLSVGVKQRVEILKALYHKSDILILDEPTAVLTPQEVKVLFSVLLRLKAMGKTIIIITHKLKETLAIADSLTILRKGKLVQRELVKDVDERKLAEQMVGRIVSFEVDRQPTPAIQDTVFELKQISYQVGHKKILNDVSFELYTGEILGIAGVEGNGQTELIQIVTGLLKATSGEVIQRGEVVKNISAEWFLEHGIGHIPEDRTAQGLIAEFPIWSNYILGYHKNKRNQTNGVLNIKRIRNDTKNIAAKFEVQCSSIEQQVQSLSGGNQQKVVIARALSLDPQIVVAAQPTRGVDIGAIEYIHSQLVKLRNCGKSILLVSADLDEVVKLSDRIAVIYEGKIVAIRKTSEFTESTLGALMLGNSICISEENKNEDS